MFRNVNDLSWRASADGGPGRSCAVSVRRTMGRPAGELRPLKAIISNRPASAVVTLAMLPLPLRMLLGGCAEFVDPVLDLAVLFG